MLRTLFVLALSGVALGAQAPRRVSLGPATATLGEEFTMLRSVRELSDGRVIANDARDQRLVVVDFAQQTARTIGRRGDGPGEYIVAGVELQPFGRDSTLMVLSSAKRWVVIGPDLSFSTMPPETPIVQSSYHVYEANPIGQLLTNGEPVSRAGVRRDTVPLLLVSWRTMKVDTIGRVDAGEEPQPPPAPRPAYPAQWDRAILTDDGWVAVVRHDPYRLEWRAPDGRWHTGGVIRDAAPLTAAERKAYLDRRAAERAANATKAVPTPGRGTKVGTRPGPPPSPDFAFPRFVPPFFSAHVPLVTGRGELLVMRHPTAADPGPLYDVFDRAGNRPYQLTLRRNQQVLGFGSSSVYVATTDNDGIQRLSRHAWPTR